VAAPAGGSVGKEDSQTGDLFQPSAAPESSSTDRQVSQRPRPEQPSREQPNPEPLSREQAVESQPAPAPASTTSPPEAAPEAVRPPAEVREPVALAPEQPAAARAPLAGEAVEAPQTAAPQDRQAATQEVVAAVAAPLPTEELTSVVASAGLEWVQTTHNAEPSEEEIVPAAARPRRQRKQKPQAAPEPLQQVETQAGDDAGA
jgi:hypothetical protein